MARRLNEFPWMPIAIGELGEAELEGPGDNPRIAEYLRSTTLPPAMADQDETPWCSGFVNWCVEQSGLEGTRSAAAISWMAWGKPVAAPRQGCVAVFTREGGNHVAFYLEQVGGLIYVLGGNQGDRVSINGYPRSRLRGFRVPA